MFKKLGQVIFKNRAGLMMLGAGIGVGAVAFFAVKDHEEYKENINEYLKNVPDDEIVNDKEDEAGDVKVESFTDFYHNHVCLKRRAIIFAKSHWRTGIAILGTELLMIFSHRSMAKQLAAVTGAMAILTSNYKEIDEYFKKNYPKEYSEFKKKVNKENIQKIFKEQPEMVKREPEDNRNRYYDPWSCQMFYATSEEEKEARLFINEQVFNTGAATLFDYLATFPSSSGIVLEDWMKHFGWYEGDTMYVDSSSYFGPFINTNPTMEKIIYKDKEEEVFVINYTHTPDIEPDMGLADIADIERQMEESYEATA